jgi:MFS family permease
MRTTDNTQLTEPNDSDGAASAAEEALVDGDVAVGRGDIRRTPGTARSALRARDFRRLWIATFSSNVGTWMQNVALGAFAYRLSHSASFVALIGFAQLGPLLVLAPIGGLLADLVDRRRLLVLTNLEQLVFSVVLAVLATTDHPSRGALFSVVLAIGIGNALAGPPLSSLLPNLVPRVDLPGAISMQSVQMNLSRVIGPAIGGLLLPAIHASGVFALNAATYLFAVAGALSIRPIPQTHKATASGLRRLFGGVAVARREPLIRTVLLTIASISFFCLPFIGLMPVVAAQNLHMDITGVAYGLLYACFGLGAASGGIVVGSVLVGRPREPVIAIALAAFGLMLGAFAVLRSAAPAYPIVFGVGFFYFASVTSLSTRLQEHLHDDVRGRVMALYMMAFGGTVPVGLLAAGPIAGATSITAVLLGGAVAAVLLAFVVRPRQMSFAVSRPTTGHVLEEPG